MNKLKFLILPLFMGFVFFSCGNNNYTEEIPPVDPPVVTPEPEDPEEILPVEPTAPFQYLTLVDVSLGADYKVLNEKASYLVKHVKHSIADVQTLVYSIHRKVDGVSVGGGSYGQERIKDEMKDGVFSFGKKLLEGEYYVSVVAMMSDDGFNHLSMDALHQNYEDAVVHIGNSHVYYGTMEVEVKADEGVVNRSALHLRKMTTDLVFEFTGIDQLPNVNIKDKYILAVGVKDIPSAFFLSTGITLTDREVGGKGLQKYKGEIAYRLPVQGSSKSFVMQYHTLVNDNLANTENERGVYWYELSEKQEDGQYSSAKILRKVEECKLDTKYHLMTEDLLTISDNK